MSPINSASTEEYLVATDLVRSYTVDRRGWFRKPTRFNAVDQVSLTLPKGKTLGIVGESGCGKSTLARLILGLLEADHGEVKLQGKDTLHLSESEWRKMRTRMQLVYQDAAGSLDPRMPVRSQVEEPLRIHQLPLQKAELALQAVGLDRAMATRYPHELSGGQLQRVVIARALVLDPEVLILDEPVSALDVSIQAQIVNLLVDLQQTYQLTYVFVSHDLSVVRHLSDQVAVMYLGRIVEQAPRDDLFANPLHPYTQALIDAVPKPDPFTRRSSRLGLGDPPNPANPPDGCRFHPRCPQVKEKCKTEDPILELQQLRRVACHFAGNA